MSDELAEFRREFAAMNEMIQSAGAGDAAALAAVRSFMEQRRGALTPALALAAADMYYLEGLSLAAVADRLAMANQGLSVNILAPHGPTEYVAVRRSEGDAFEVQRVPVAVSVASRRKLASMVEQGWRFAPAALRVDPDTVDAAELWDRLGKM